MKKDFIELAQKLMCPPGNGVFTVNTAKERKEKLHNVLYKDSYNIEESWKQSLDEKLDGSNTFLLGVCCDTGGGIQRGANWGPLFLRNTLLDEHEDLKYNDLGDIRVIPHLLHDKYLNEETIKNCQKALYNDDKSNLPVSALSLTESICDQFYKSFPEKKLFSIGGDHSVSYPLVKSYLKAKKSQNKNVAIIHFDAHTDLLTERLGIDICFGSWCTHVLEFLNKPEYLLQFGIRSSGKDRSHWEKNFDIQQYWAKEIKEKGATKVAEQVCEYLKHQKIDELYVSFDIDALDEKFASATGTPEPEGMSPDEAITIINIISNSFPITGADMVEIAPLVCADHVEHPEPFTTLTYAAAISAKLIESMNK